MKSKNTEHTVRILTLLKIDANNLFDRIKNRKNQYLEIFALRRTREHFEVIFKNRYQDTSLTDLASCSQDLIHVLNQFYTHAEEMSWYLYQTEDMPNTVDDFIHRKIIKMEKLLSTLNLFLDAELGISQDTPSDEAEPLPDEVFTDIFSDDNSQEV